MANLYEFDVNSGIVKKIVKEVGLALPSDSEGTIIENLMSIFGRPSTFQKVYMDGKPGFCVRVGLIRTSAFEGIGLHVFTHSGSEGYLDMQEFDSRLQACLTRHRVKFTKIDLD